MRMILFSNHDSSRLYPFYLGKFCHNLLTWNVGLFWDTPSPIKPSFQCPSWRDSKMGTISLSFYGVLRPRSSGSTGRIGLLGKIYTPKKTPKPLIFPIHRRCPVILLPLNTKRYGGPLGLGLDVSDPSRRPFLLKGTTFIVSFQFHWSKPW